MHHHRGYILLTTLILLQIYSLLGLTLLEQALLSQKNLATQKTQNQAFLEAQSLLPSLDPSNPNCQIPITPPSQLKSQTLSWWLTQACSIPAHDYTAYYLSETLDHNPSVCVQNGSATYYRLSLLILKEHDESSQLMLQSTMVIGDSNGEICQGERQMLDPGLQAWRII